MQINADRMQLTSAPTRGQHSISAVLSSARGGRTHSLVIKVLVMSHGEGVGGGWDRELKREEKERGEREGEEVRGWGLLALPPGVLSSCQEADRFPLSGLESACSVFSDQHSCLSIYLQHTSSQNSMSTLQSGWGSI